MTDDIQAETQTMTEEQFRERFVAYFVRCLGPELAGCAEEIWESYWDNPDQRANGPEDCAAEELDEWYD